MAEEPAREQDGLAEALMEAFGLLGGVELELPIRVVRALAVEFEKE